jgi:rhamnose utilization protein RhaD (predicted bifunctional aldolase and dehydrogenase)
MSPGGEAADPRAELVRLSRELGRPEADLVVLAEGNAAVRVGPDAMLVKATGAMMRDAEPDDFVTVSIAALLELLDGPGDDAAVAAGFRRARIDGSRRASVEAILHAVCLTAGGATVVAHTHPTAVNAVLCSRRAADLADVALFPDQVVVLGSAPLFVEYHDPGVPLARQVRRQLVAHLAEHGTPPRVVYLANHGMFALGAAREEVLQVTTMAVKTARVLAGTWALGGPRPMTTEHVLRIDTRPDELLRRAALAARPSTADDGSGPLATTGEQ